MPYRRRRLTQVCPPPTRRSPGGPVGGMHQGPAGSDFRSSRDSGAPTPTKMDTVTPSPPWPKPWTNCSSIKKSRALSSRPLWRRQEEYRSRHTKRGALKRVDASTQLAAPSPPPNKKKRDDVDAFGRGMDLARVTRRRVSWANRSPNGALDSPMRRVDASHQGPCVGHTHRRLRILRGGRRVDAFQNTAFCGLRAMFFLSRLEGQSSTQEAQPPAPRAAGTESGCTPPPGPPARRSSRSR